MKRPILLLFLFVLAMPLSSRISFAAHADNDYPYETSTSTTLIPEEEIPVAILDLIVPKTKGPRHVLSSYVSVSVNADTGIVNFSFLSSFGEVEIEIIHTSLAIIVFDTVNTGIGQSTMTVPVEAGNYIIIIRGSDYEGQGSFSF